jgi:hypothetical protein
MKTDNELIAEFMGFKKVGNVMEKWEDGYTSVLCCDIKDLKYYEGSWDWLMPVVEKIENTGDGFISRVTGCRIEGYLCDFVDQENTEISLQFSQTAKIDAVYKAVVEFIKWHNQQKP